MSSYRNQISCCVTDKVTADLSATAAKREMTVAALVRQAIYNEIYVRTDPLPEIHRYTAFVTFAVDELMRAHPDAELRAKVHKLWNDYLASREARHGD